MGYYSDQVPTSLTPRPSHLPNVPEPIGVHDLSVMTGLAVVRGQAREALYDPTPDALTRAFLSHREPFVFGSEYRGHIFFGEPGEVNDVLVDKAGAFIKGEEEIALSSAIGWGLLTDEGVSHRKNQHGMAPGLRHEAMHTYVSGAWQNARSALEQLSDRSGVSLVDWSRNFSQASAEALLLPSSHAKPNPEFARRLFTLNALAMTSSSSDTWQALSLAEARRFFEDREWLLEYAQVLINLQANGSEAAGLWEFFLDEEEAGSSLLAQTMLFLQAATETTGSLISWLLIALARKPIYWDYLFEEARLVAGAESLDYREMMALPWHRAVILEALRLYPAAWMLPRIATDQVKVGPIEVPVGARVWLSPWVTHRLPESFDNATRFEPERWNTQLKSPSRGQYFPFGLGNRLCIGERFSKMNATVLLLSISMRGAPPVLSDTSELVATASVIANPPREVELFLAPEASE